MQKWVAGEPACLSLFPARRGDGEGVAIISSRLPVPLSSLRDSLCRATGWQPVSLPATADQVPQFLTSEKEEEKEPIL